MINLTGEQKIRGFMADKVMYEAVKEVLRESFMKSGDNVDVNVLASQMMAITLLDDGFKELNKYSRKAEVAERDANNPGV